MFVFDSATLRHLLEQIKVQIDKKISIEQYAIKAETTDADALVVGTDIQLNNSLIQDLIAKGIDINIGDKVLIKSKVLSEANYTQEEKEVVQEILEHGGLEEMLDARLDGLDLNVLTNDEYNKLVDNNELDANKLYIVTDEEAVAIEIDNYVTREEYDELAALKVDRVSYINSSNETVDKVLSTNDFTEAYKVIVDFIHEKGGIAGLVTNDEIVDSLDSNDEDKPLSANQGRILKEEYLGNMKHQYISQKNYDALEEKAEDVIYHIDDAETLYGLTEEQMMHLKAAYEFSLRDLEQYYAKKEEVYQARKNLDGHFFPSLSERLCALDELANTIVYDMNEISNTIVGRYGVRVDFEEEEYTRLYNAVGKEGGADFDICYPWSHMIRCNMIDGEVVAYEGSPEYIEDGSNGDVMVEIPKFWYKVNPLRTEDAASGEGLQLLEAEWIIADRPYPSYKVHPAFIRDGKEVDKIYVGAFEGCVFDASERAYLLNNEDQIDFSNDKMSSIANALPCTNVKFSDLVALCQNKGLNYDLFDIRALAAIQLLFLIEHASFDSQGCIGDGIVNKENTPDTYLGEVTNSVNSVNYRGIENLWGNARKYINGLVGFTSASSSKYQLRCDNGYEPNSIISFKVDNATGYISKIGYDPNNDFVFLPIELNGSSNTGLCDAMFKGSSSLDSHLVGAGWSSGKQNGLWSCSFMADNHVYIITNGRIQFAK